MAAHGDDARILAGGQSLVPLMNLRMARPEMLVSINRCAELNFIRQENAHLVIGALVRQVDAERNSNVRESCPLLAAALPYLGPAATRNRGTVCGSLAHADPTAELPAVALALDADMIIAGPGGDRRVPAAEFFLGELTTALGPGEVLHAVAFQCQQKGERSVFLEVGNRSHGFAVAGLALRWHMNGSDCDFARIAVIGAGATACRIPDAEQALIGSAMDDATVSRAVDAVEANIEPVSDVHADADYRRHVLGVLLRRGLGERGVG